VHGECEDNGDCQGDAGVVSRGLPRSPQLPLRALPGDALDPRKRFIQTHAKVVRNLDI
jgi:hypothetical protein